MTTVTFLAFFFLGASFLSLWLYRDAKIWGTLLGLSLLSGFFSGNILAVGFLSFIGLAALWYFYDRWPSGYLFLAIIIISTCFKLRLFPGYPPFFFTYKFIIGLGGALIGLFPLALFTPLAKTGKDWEEALKGLFYGCIGIAVIALLATLLGAVHWRFKIPSMMTARTLSALFLTAIPEEGFYRGFVQKKLFDYFKNLKIGKALALLLTSLLFTATHFLWSPNLAILGFVFLASLLYGGVYWISGKIESAILTHFLLNFIHLLFFASSDSR